MKYRILLMIGLLAVGMEVRGEEIAVLAPAETNQEPAVVSTNRTDSDLFAHTKSSERSLPIFDGGQKASAFNPWRSIGATLFILCALIAVNLYIRKGRLGQSLKGSRRIRMLERFAIDHKRSLLLLDVDGRKVLVGVGVDRIEPVLSWDKDAGFEETLSGKVDEMVRSKAVGLEAP